MKSYHIGPLRLQHVFNNTDMRSVFMLHAHAYMQYTACSRVTAPSPLAGETMRITSSEFADDPCSSVKRGTMVRAARALLSAVTRLLILADMADVMRLLAHLKIVSAIITFSFFFRRIISIILNLIQQGVL